MDQRKGLRAVATVALVLVLSACAQDQPPGSRDIAPAGGFEGTDEYYFETLPRMVATVDLVVVATVQDVRPGRSVGAEGDEFPVEFVDAVLQVSQLLHGSAQADSITVETLEAQTYVTDWRKAGHEVLIFLSKGDALSKGRYYPTNSQSVLLVDGQNLSGTIKDPLVEQLASISLAEIEEDIARANQLIQEGQVEPVPRFGSG